MADPEVPEEVPEISLPPQEELAQLPDAELAQLVAAFRDAERRIKEQMAPFQLRLTRLAQTAALAQTEVRRRERQRHIASRQAVRTQVREGAAPSLADAVEAQEPPDFGELEFAELTFLLESGGQVALGYPGTRTPSLQMTDGQQVRAVAGLREARQLYREGWEIGVPAKRGVRVHTPGTRLERLLDAEKCFLRPLGAPAPGEATS